MARYQYLAPQAHERYNGCLPHRVLTPDGGVIFCVTEADANRIVRDMNAICDELSCHEPHDNENPIVTGIIGSFMNGDWSC